MFQPRKLSLRRVLQGASGAVVGTALLLAGCATAPPPAPPAKPPVARAPAPAPAPAAPQPRGETSSASSARDYRRDGAHHLYARYPERIYKGRLPPMLPGVGVVDVRIDRGGNVTHISWVRAPSDRSFMPITEKLIRGASPFPAPVRLGSVTYTEIWLWDKSGKFQLDTLTEGQRSE